MDAAALATWCQSANLDSGSASAPGIELGAAVRPFSGGRSHLMYPSRMNQNQNRVPHRHLTPR